MLGMRTIAKAKNHFKQLSTNRPVSTAADGFHGIYFLRRSCSRRTLMEIAHLFVENLLFL